MKQAAIDTDKTLMKTIHSYSYAGVPVANGWVSPLNGAEFGTDYFSRAAAAKANIFVNPRKESAYFGQEYDATGKRLSGAAAYSVTFPKDQLPPVNGFWSLTLYDEEHFFAPNKINRFSLGTKNKDLVYGADGSLTIYVQNREPKGREGEKLVASTNGKFRAFSQSLLAEGCDPRKRMVATGCDQSQLSMQDGCFWRHEAAVPLMAAVFETAWSIGIKVRAGSYYRSIDRMQ